MRPSGGVCLDMCWVLTCAWIWLPSAMDIVDSDSTAGQLLDVVDGRSQDAPKKDWAVPNGCCIWSGIGPKLLNEKVCDAGVALLRRKFWFKLVGNVTQYLFQSFTWLQANPRWHIQHRWKYFLSSRKCTTSFQSVSCLDSELLVYNLQFLLGVMITS